MFQDLDPQWSKPLWEDEAKHAASPDDSDNNQTLLEAMLAEYEQIKDVSDPEAELGSIVRYRMRLATELERVKEKVIIY